LIEEQPIRLPEIVQRSLEKLRLAKPLRQTPNQRTVSKTKLARFFLSEAEPNKKIKLAAGIRLLMVDERDGYCIHIERIGREDDLQKAIYCIGQGEGDTLENILSDTKQIIKCGSIKITMPEPGKVLFELIAFVTPPRPPIVTVPLLAPTVAQNVPADPLDARTTYERSPDIPVFQLSPEALEIVHQNKDMLLAWVGEIFRGCKKDDPLSADILYLSLSPQNGKINELNAIKDGLANVRLGIVKMSGTIAVGSVEIKADIYDNLNLLAIVNTTVTLLNSVIRNYRQMAIHREQEASGLIDGSDHAYYVPIHAFIKDCEVHDAALLFDRVEELS